MRREPDRKPGTLIWFANNETLLNENAYQKLEELEAAAIKSWIIWKKLTPLTKGA